MNPYEIDINDLKVSKNIENEKDILRYKLTAIFVKIATNFSTEEILEKTGLHKSDLSRLRSLNFDRFSIDRIIGLLDSLGYSTNLSDKPKKEAS